MLIKKKYSLITVFSLVFLLACNEEFLEYKPIGLDTTETFFTNFENLDYTATAAYGMLSSREVYDVIYTIGYQSASDDVETGGENVNDLPEYQRMDKLTHSSNENRVYRAWAYPYKGIRMTNEFLTRAEDIKVYEMEKAKSDNEATSIKELIDLRSAEMHYLRAFYHFTLLQLYGGVPIVNYLMDPDQFDSPRNSIAEVLHFVQSELKLALPFLKVKSELGNDMGRASLGAAKSLLAKSLLYESSYAKYYPNDDRFDGCEQKFDEVLQYTEEVINSGEYALVGINGERFPSWRAPLGGTIGGYRWIFTVDGDNCAESVWDIQSVNDGAGWVESRGNYITIFSTIRFCFAKDGTPGKTAGGWSFNLPSKYMVNAFGNSDSRETDLNSTAMLPGLDPRFSTSIGIPGDSVLVAESGGAVWYEMDFQNLPTKTISRKYECSPDEYWSGKVSDQNGPMNIRHIRYADVVLMAAEAAYELGNNAKALTYVNQVRTRARESGDTGFPMDLTTISFEDIVHERRLEFAMEANRFFDVVRWNLTEKYLDGITLASMGDGFKVNFEKGKHEFFPIPEFEMQKSPGLVQYEAWR